MVEIDLENCLLYKSVVRGKIADVSSSLKDKVFSWDFDDENEDHYVFRRSLQKAIELNNKDIVQVMLQSNFGESKFGFGTSKPQYVAEALEVAARLGKKDIVKNILEFEKDYVRKITNALAHAAWSDNIPILQMLIDAGASPNLETEWGTPLIVAAQSGNIKAVKFLVEVGADPNKSVDMDGHRSPLLAAANTGNKEICTYLIPLVYSRKEIKIAQKLIALLSL
jgi:ankyrin repeat protein